MVFEFPSAHASSAGARTRNDELCPQHVLEPRTADLSLERSLDAQRARSQCLCDARQVHPGHPLLDRNEARDCELFAQLPTRQQVDVPGLDDGLVVDTSSELYESRQNAATAAAISSVLYRWGVERMSVPLSARMRRISRRAAVESRMCSTTSEHTTRSNEPLSEGRPRDVVSGENAGCRARCACGPGDRDMHPRCPTRRHDARSLSASGGTTPEPGPTSRARRAAVP